jgi:universal stress protein F
MKRILVAVDGSPRAPIVLAAAAQLAKLAGAKLVLFRAINVPADLRLDVIPIRPEDLEGALRAEARAALDGCVATVSPDLVESCETELGIPWDAIVRAGRERNADLIVIGSHGYGGLDRLLGTTAAKVVNHADRNVLIIRNAL